MAWYRIVMECSGVPPDAGATGANDIMEAFTRRPWHQNVRCTWDGVRLTLTAENDFDRKGLALMDEFSDEMSACISRGFNGDLRIVSITEVTPKA
jgi:hypothetical protein|nr:hypothetical protein [uncultured Rhodopila sp.]